MNSDHQISNLGMIPILLKLLERINMNDWCNQQDIVTDGDKIHRCSKCGKRLHPRRMFDENGDFSGWQLPPHKEKGHKIRTARKNKKK